MAEERLQKILAHAGIASRRKAEQYIAEGRVTVNGSIVTELGTKANPARDHVKVDGRLLRAEKPVYLALHKPKNCVSTVHDPQGRETVMKFLKGVKARIYPVGRLDYSSEGLLLFTNDGDFANRITAPARHVVKTYETKVTGTLSAAQEERFRRGMVVQGRRTAAAGLKLIRRGENPWYEIQLVEGRQNQIRLMFKQLGYMVEKLKRVKIGFLALGDLPPTAVRHLTGAEVARFRKLLKLEAAAAED